MKIVENGNVELDVYDIINLEYFIAIADRKMDEFISFLQEEGMSLKEAEEAYAHNKKAAKEMADFMTACRVGNLHLITKSKE